MGKLGRPSSVSNHPAVQTINRMLDGGETYDAIIRTVGNVSASALSRYAISRKSELAKVADDNTGVITLLGRLTDVADHARELRKLSRISGTPMAQARAIKAETDVLNRMISSLGVDGNVLGDIEEEIRALVTALTIFRRSFPESAEDLIEILHKTPQTTQLALALDREGKKNS